MPINRTQRKKWTLPRSAYFYSLAVFSGLGMGYLQNDQIIAVASITAEIFLRLLRLVSLPIIFLSILSTASGMEDLQLLKGLAQKVVKYTLLTTILAAACALGIFSIIEPTSGLQIPPGTGESLPGVNYLNHVANIVPANFLQPFLENNVIGTLFLAVLLAIATIMLPVQRRATLHSIFSSFYQLIMKLISFIIQLLPAAIWSFIVLFFRDINRGFEFKSLALYLACILTANLIQAFVILPLLLKLKGISPGRIAHGMFPALSIAFFTKSSNAALPMAMECAQRRLKISERVTHFSFPLCTTINMNGCAAFILITVLFVSMSQGLTFGVAEKILWIFVATVAAVGNAGVPMGCFFLASALLSAMEVPVHLMGVILPFYAFIDMIETAVNVWSDSCVAVMVDQDLHQKA